MFKLFYFLALFLFSKNILAEIIEYPEKDWPAQNCNGLRNSPIDFPQNYNYNTTNYFKIISTNYKLFNGMKMMIINNESHAINVTSPDMGELFVRKNGITYRYILSGVHFHINSEHTFNGKPYQNELHMVHKKDLDYLAKNNITDTDEDKVNKFLVVGTWFEVAPSDIKNPDFEKFGISSGTPDTINNLNLTVFSRPDQSYYHYIGGLTTPTCDEVVNWVVNTNPVKISAEQNVG
jgi:carbonic anhydrase